jgi:hypothetical protein
MGNVKERPVTIKALQRRGVHILPGNEYIPKRWLPKRTISIEEVHKRLAGIRGSLADDVAEMRDEG